jgi:tetratricopeptide (TPR) repeat protein
MDTRDELRAPTPSGDLHGSSGRRPASAAVVVAVAVLIGLGVGRFVTAGSPEPEVATTRVAAAADLAGQVSQLERAVAGDPTDLGSLQALGAAYVSRAAETGDASFYGLSRRALERAEALAPGDPETLLARGNLALALHDFDEALELGDRARAQRPDTAAVLGVVVDAQVELGRYDAAAETLQTMLDRKPGLPALSRASYLRELQGDVAGAVTAMQQARSAGTPGSYDLAVVTTLLGDLLYARGQLDEADTAYDDALRAAPGIVSAVHGKARVQAARGDTDGAVSALQQLVDRRPTVDGLTLLAELQRLAGDAAAADETAALVRSVAALQESSGQVVDLEMALFEADQGDAATALRLARAAHAARPDNVFVNDALAWALLRSGDAAAAVPHVDRALRLGTADPLLRYHAAEVFAAAGDEARARSELQAVAATPSFSFCHLRAAGALADRLGVEAPPAWRGP